MAKTWTAEFVFYGSPLSSSHSKEQGTDSIARNMIYFVFSLSYL